MIHHGDYRETLAGETWDLFIPDAPYSERTHTGHSSAAVHNGRSDLEYGFWTPDDVRECVEFAAPRTRGWMVSITDHVLAPEWERAMEDAGRYASFAPVPWVSKGSRVRLCGGGPSSWTCWIIVSRPKGREFANWPTTPGAYFNGTDRGGRPKSDTPMVGDKPLGLMLDLVRDYSREGDVVCDPTAGHGTALVAAKKLGRVPLGSEARRCAFEVARRRLGESCAGEGLPLFEVSA